MPADPDRDAAALDARLQEAARAGDAGTLATIYRCAAQSTERPDEAGFLLTHAYVWALVAGDAPTAEALALALRREGRLD